MNRIALLGTGVFMDFGGVNAPRERLEPQGAQRYRGKTEGRREMPSFIRLGSFGFARGRLNEGARLSTKA